MKYLAKTLKDTEKLAKYFVETLDEKGLFVTLTGDIGAGKTQFVRMVLNFLNIKDNVTSPSFVILNEYKCDKFPVYHFDLYRLEEKGLKSVVCELREYSKENNLTFIEWAEFAHDEIPDDSLKINVSYDENNIDIRCFEFSSKNKYAQNFIDKLSEKAGLK